MSCTLIQRNGSRLLDDSLPAATAAACRRHLGSCPACRRRLAESRRLHALLARLGEAPVPSAAGTDPRVARAAFRWWSADPHDPLAGAPAPDAADVAALLAGERAGPDEDPALVRPGLAAALLRRALFDAWGPAGEAARRCAGWARAIAARRAPAADPDGGDLAGVAEAVSGFLERVRDRPATRRRGLGAASEAAPDDRTAAAAPLETSFLRAAAHPGGPGPRSAEIVAELRRTAPGTGRAVAGRLLQFARCLAGGAYEAYRFSAPPAYRATCETLARWTGPLLELATEPAARPVALDCAAWVEIHRGNALSILSRFDEAETALGRAARRAVAGSGSPRLEIHLRSHLARHRSRQGRWDAALEEFDRALSLARRISDPHRVGCLLSDQSIVLAEMGELERSDALLGEALELLDARRSPSRVLFAQHNRVVNLHERGNPDAAVALLREIYPLYAEHARGSNVTRLRWVEASIVAQQGDHAGAARLYRAVRDDFVRMSMPREATLVSLELVAALLAGGRTAEVAAVAADTVELCRHPGIAREAIAATILLRRAARAERLTSSLLRRLARRVERSVR